MKIESLKDLEAMLKVCRKQGVLAIKVDGIELSLGDVPENKPKGDTSDKIETPDALSGEELMFWSSADRV